MVTKMTTGSHRLCDYPTVSSAVDVYQCASGEKLAETKNRDELRRRYDVFEMVVNAIASSAQSPTSESHSTFSPPQPTYAPHEVKRHSLADLVVRSRVTGGGMTKDDAIRLLEACDPQLLVKFMLPKRRFWKDEQKMKSGFSTDFSMARGPNRVLTPLKSASNIRISSFVPPSKIFVWEG